MAISLNFILNVLNKGGMMLKKTSLIFKKTSKEIQKSRQRLASLKLLPDKQK